MADPSPDDDSAKRRYEGLFRAMRRRSLLGLGLCFAATALFVVIYTSWLAQPFAQTLLQGGLPAWLVSGVTAALVLTIGLTLPNLAQLIVINGETAAAIEAANAWGLAESEQWKRMGLSASSIRRADQVLPTLAELPDLRGSPRVRLLAWAGAFDLARMELAEMPKETAIDRFEIALLTAMVNFVESGSASLADAHEAFASVQADEQDRARLALAFETARLEHDAGRPWQTPLAAARREVKVPRAATFLGRLLSMWKGYAAVIGAGTLIAIFLTLTD
jgi:hypothetical protein